MIRKNLFILNAAVCIAACGGSKGAEPANAADESVEMQSADAAETSAPASTEDAASEGATPAEGDKATGDENSSESVDEESSSEDEAAAQPSEQAPSDDLQSYVGTSGAYTPEYRTVTDNMDTIKQCYLDAIRITPDVQGMLKVRFTVNKAGKVTKAKATVNELNDQIAQCVIGALKKLKFPKRADIRTVEYPFKFIPAP